MDRYTFDEKTQAAYERLQNSIAIFQLLGDGIVPIVISDGYCEMFGFDNQEEAYAALNKDVFFNVHPEDASRILDESLAGAKAGGKYEVGVLSETFSQLTARIRDDMNELNALNEQLKEDNLILEAATTRDELTEVRNRACFRRDYVSFDDKELNLVLIDLDDFKKINDVYGLPAGDALLKETGKALTDCINSEYIYRYAGDEFLFIVPDGKEEELKIMLDALKERLAGMKVGDKDVPVRFSAGYVYGRTLLQDDLRLMIHQAEVMLYKAKESGKNAFMGNEYDRTFALNIKQNGEEVFLRG